MKSHIYYIIDLENSRFVMEMFFLSKIKLI